MLRYFVRLSRFIFRNQVHNTSQLQPQLQPKMEQQSILRFFNLKSQSQPSQATKRQLLPSASPSEKPTPLTHETSPPNKKPKHVGSESDTAQVSDEKLNSESDESKLIELSEKQESLEVKNGSKMPYSSITLTLEKIEHELSRLAMTAIVSQFFLDVLNQFQSPDKLIKIVYLFINRLGPDYEPDLELGLGETLLIKAISECYGRAPAKIKKHYHEVGDLGKVAQASRSGQPTMFKPTPLDVDTVFDNLTKIAKATGKDSQSRKVGIINKMLTACDLKSQEAKFLIRSLEGKLRIGLAEKTVLVALAQSFVHYENTSGKKMSPETLQKAEDVLKEAFSMVPNYEIIIRTCYEHGIMNLLEHCTITPGVPLKPMLAKPTKSISEVLDRFQGEQFTCEYKYDGERAQVHLLPDGSVRIYSRNSEDMSGRYPDLVGIIKDFIKKTDNADSTDEAQSLILDCEAVAWDREQKKILPFQVLSTRKRKDVAEKDIKVHICLFAFDLLYYNGKSLITKSFEERRNVLFENFQTIEGKFHFATYKNSSDLDELQSFLDQSVKDSCEGLMVKTLHGNDSYYEPSKRSRNWLKLKKDYLSGVGDSLDLVVIGAYVGRGKRTGGYGGFLLASYDDDSGQYETTCKIGTGFSEEMLADLHAKLKPTEIAQPKAFYVFDEKNSNASPDVWFEPTTVFEVLTADLSLSPVYKASHLTYGKGISLRFPRFLRIRDDKGVEDATTSTQVAEFYERQSNN